MKTAELTGAQLDYWVARAEGIPAEQLEIRIVPRTDWLHVVRMVPVSALGYPELHQVAGGVMRYSTEWAQGGPLIEKREIDLTYETDGQRRIAWCGPTHSYGDTPLQAICRAVVRAEFGDDVEEAPVAQA